MIGIMMDFNVVLWGKRLRAVSARPYKALAKSLFSSHTFLTLPYDVVKFSLLSSFGRFFYG